VGRARAKQRSAKPFWAWFKDQKLRYKLASPTGRAARRLSEVTGDEALTLHRLLEFDPQLKCFIRGADEPLKTDLVLLDEISMVEMTLFNDLLKALPDACRLILIGDSDQLPSVGPGAVLAELLQSKVIPAVKLTEIYRQAQASRIVRNAHRVNQGEPPVLLPPTGRNRSEDAFFIASTQPDDTTTQLLDLVSRRLPAAGYAPTDIQVLCPMRKGLIGTQALNRALQAVLNPAPASLTPEAEVQVSHQRLRLGDRVIQLKNNYELEIFNGDLGQVVEVYPGERRLKVAFVDKNGGNRRRSIAGTGSGVCPHDSQIPGGRIPGCDSAPDPPAPHHVAAQSALHRHDPRPEIIGADGRPLGNRTGRTERTAQTPQYTSGRALAGALWGRPRSGNRLV
jgi:exodeoxyribonuclease V alpha subunit